jgi:hypothetical protein
MKKDTTLEQMINMLKSVEYNTHSIYSDKVILRKMINFLESWMPDERRKIESWLGQPFRFRKETSRLISLAKEQHHA